MSYSFTVRAATKAEALKQAEAKLDEVAVQQPIHAIDVKQAKAGIESFVALVAEDKTKDFVITANGSIATTFEGAVFSANFGCGAYATFRP